MCILPFFDGARADKEFIEPIKIGQIRALGKVLSLSEIVTSGSEWNFTSGELGVVIDQIENTVRKGNLR